jgi:hypothetical protein
MQSMIGKVEKEFALLILQRDLIHNRLNLLRPNWVQIHKYLDMMEEGFVHRQNWRVTIEEF